MSTTPNLLQREHFKRPFFKRPLVVLGLVGVGAFAFGRLLFFQGPLRASITDTLSSPETTEGSYDTDLSSRPRIIERTRATALAQGLKRDSIRFYEVGTGKAFQIQLRTLQKETLSDTILEGFTESWWIPQSEQVITAFDDGVTVSHRFYDYRTKDVREIGSVVHSLAISPDGEQLAFVDIAGDAATLSIANVDGSNAKTILKTRATEVDLSWPRKDVLVMVTQRLDRVGRDMTAVGTDGSLLPLLTNREGLEYTWSPDGSLLLFSFYTPEEGISLWYRSLTSPIEAPLGVQTSASKCAWSSDGDRIVCGVPKTNTLSRDVSAEQTATIDDIVRIELSTGKKETLYSGSKTDHIGVIDPVLSSTDSFFVFTNLFDRYLYAIEL